jgi:hypothetical protein
MDSIRRPDGSVEFNFSCDMWVLDVLDFEIILEFMFTNLAIESY